MKKITDITKQKISNKTEVSQLLEKARSYLLTQKWCREIKNTFLAENYGYVFCLFYFEIEPSDGADEYVWVIVGDIPSAYIDIESAKDSKEAISCYIFLMEDWINHILENKSIDDSFPVLAEPSLENAKNLQIRINLLEKYLS